MGGMSYSWKREEGGGSTGGHSCARSGRDVGIGVDADVCDRMASKEK